MAQKWQNCFIKTTKSHDITKDHLILKTSVSARAPWVRIPPPPLSTTDFYKNYSYAEFFIAYYFGLISLVFGKFSVDKVKKVVNFRSTQYKLILIDSRYNMEG